MKVAAIVLAAGASSRFGSQKLLAPLDGRPVLQHVLDAVAAAGIEHVVVVLGDSAAEIEAGISWRGERRVINPRPQDGLASSLRVGLDGVTAWVPQADAAFIVLGDQPALRPEVVRAVVAAASGTAGSDLPIVRARYAADAAPNPVLVLRSAWALAAGLWPAIEASGPCSPITRNSSSSSMWTASTPTSTHPRTSSPRGREHHDHVGPTAPALEEAWAERVRANREQAERMRETQVNDFYGPVAGLFVADPRRTGEPTLDALLALADPNESWLDIGAGAGRYALPLALHVRRVIAVEPSSGMRRALRTGLGRARDRQRAHGAAGVAGCA